MPIRVGCQSGNVLSGIKGCGSDNLLSPQRGQDRQIPGLRLPLFPRAIGSRQRPAAANRGGVHLQKLVFDYPTP
jgi:hypothetical protein